VLVVDGRSTEDCLILRHAGRGTRTLDLSAPPCRRSVVRASARDLQIRFFSAPTGTSNPAGAHWVHGDADALAGWRVEKDLRIAAFLKRLMGFEPTTFCMASRTCSTGFPRFIPANRQFLGHWTLAAIARYSTRDHGGLCTECVPGGWARPQTRPADGAEPGCRSRRHRHHPALARARAAELS
jgi:hypothetical protein